MEKEVNITAARYTSFKIEDDWYEVFLGSVRRVIYARSEILRIPINNWRDNKQIVAELKRLGY